MDPIPKINGLLVPWKRFGQLKAEPLSLEVELDLGLQVSGQYALDEKRSAYYAA